MELSRVAFARSGGADRRQGLGRCRRPAGLVVSALAIVTLGVAACTPRTEIPSTVPGTVPAIAPTEKNMPCGFNPNGNCIDHHNNNRHGNANSGNGGGWNGPSGGGGHRGGGGGHNSGGGGGRGGGGGGGRH